MHNYIRATYFVKGKVETDKAHGQNHSSGCFMSSIIIREFEITCVVLRAWCLAETAYLKAICNKDGVGGTTGKRVKSVR